MPQGRNEEIRKGGIGIGKKKKKKKEKEEVEKDRGQRTTGESCTLIYVVRYKNGGKRGREEESRVERRNANGENS